jgi:hypothetical protein
MRQRGYVERQNIVVEFPAADGTADPLPRLAEELVRSNVEVILAPGLSDSSWLSYEGGLHED